MMDIFIFDLFLIFFGWALGRSERLTGELEYARCICNSASSSSVSSDLANGASQIHLPCGTYQITSVISVYQTVFAAYCSANAAALAIETDSGKSH
jgi:hypothetical protein